MYGVSGLYDVSPLNTVRWSAWFLLCSSNGHQTASPGTRARKKTPQHNLIPTLAPDDDEDLVCSLKERRSRAVL